MAMCFVLGESVLPSYLMRMTSSTLKDRAVLRISGEEVRPFLQGLVTQDVLSLAEGEPRWAGLLTAQGKALFDFLLWADGDDVLIDCEAGAAEALARRLMLYRLRRKIEIAVDGALGVHWAPEAEGRPLDPRLPLLGYRWIAPPGEGDASDAFRRHRLSLGVTEGIAEIGSDQTLWLEANAEELHGVDFRKGCYVGQENTARMHYRSKVNRRLVVVPIEQSEPARQRAVIPELGLAIDHRRTEDMAGIDLPEWLALVIGQQAE
jgi:folate-binding protein YgfZ